MRVNPIRAYREYRRRPLDEIIEHASELASYFEHGFDPTRMYEVENGVKRCIWQRDEQGDNTDGCAPEVP